MHISLRTIFIFLLLLICGGIFFTYKTIGTNHTIAPRNVVSSILNNAIPSPSAEVVTTSNSALNSPPRTDSDLSPTNTSRVTPLQWGAYPGQRNDDAATFESLVGKPINLRPIFVGWGYKEDFFLQYALTVRDKQKTLVVFWEQTGVTLDSIIAGHQDKYIQGFASQLKTYRGPVILAPFHEMNIRESPWSGVVGTNTPAKIIRAWQHIHDQFSEVSNVKFAWVVNSNSVPNTAANAITAYYPGDAYVDYVAIDGFNFNAPWVSFDEIFGSALQTLKQYHKPIYILSMATAPGSKKAAWITDALTIQIPKYTEIVGWVWFNEKKEADWRVNSDAASLAAFKASLP